jgi:hypothetical protein
MVTGLRSRFWRLFQWGSLLFALLFLFRLLYGYVAPTADVTASYDGDFFSSLQNVRKNYASEKISADGQSQLQAAANQKFEKTASLRTKTAEFDRDTKQVRQTVTSYSAVIQYEQSSGQKSNRQLHLLIGVNPARFDSFYMAVQKVGVLRAIEITKVDKTNEYRQLNARKVSLEKTLASLNELKSKGGQIADFVALNDKILEIQGSLQELGVELGNFDVENEFCTVRLSMYEGETQKNISLVHRIKVALEWTIKYYSVLVFTIFGVALTILILLFILDKLKIISALIERRN